MPASKKVSLALVTPRRKKLKNLGNVVPLWIDSSNKLTAEHSTTKYYPELRMYLRTRAYVRTSSVLGCLYTIQQGSYPSTLRILELSCRLSCYLLFFFMV